MISSKLSEWWHNVKQQILLIFLSISLIKSDNFVSDMCQCAQTDVTSFSSWWLLYPEVWSCFQLSNMTFDTPTPLIKLISVFAWSGALIWKKISSSHRIVQNFEITAYRFVIEFSSRHQYNAYQVCNQQCWVYT